MLGESFPVFLCLRICHCPPWNNFAYRYSHTLRGRDLEFHWPSEISCVRHVGFRIYAWNAV